MPIYEVAIVYRGQDNYLVDAKNKDEAGKIGEEKWRTSEKPDLLGNEWEEIERIAVYTIPKGEI